MKLYEGMFLFDNTAAFEWEAVEAEVKRLFDRIEAKQLVCVKFDERRLAFEIDGRKRGTYVLTYFEAEPDRITALERDGRLSEMILRMLVLRPEAAVTPEKIAELQAHQADKPLCPSSDGRRGDRDRFGDRDRYDRDDRDRGRDRDRPPREDRKEREESKPEGEPQEATSKE